MNELNDVKFRNVIPAYASLDESALYVIEKAESDFTEMMKHIGLVELGVLESTGETIVYEGGKLQALIDTIVKWLKDRWADIQGMFNKALKFFKDKFDEFSSKIKDKKIAALKKKVELIKDKEYGKSYEYAEFDNIVNGSGSIWDAVHKFQKGINDLQWQFMSSKNDVTASVVNDIREDFEELKENLAAAFGLSGSAKESEYKEAVKETIRGREIIINKMYLKGHIESMFEDATSYNKIAKKVKSQFNVIKKDFEKDIAAVKKEKKSANETILNMYLPYLKFSKNVTTAIAGATVHAVKEKMSTDMRMILKLVVAGKEKEDTSAYYESTTFQTELASLFDF